MSVGSRGSGTRRGMPSPLASGAEYFIDGNRAGRCHGGNDATGMRPESENSGKKNGVRLARKRPAGSTGRRDGLSPPAAPRRDACFMARSAGAGNNAPCLSIGALFSGGPSLLELVERRREGEARRARAFSLGRHFRGG